MSNATASNIGHILRLDVPIVVRVGERPLKVSEVTAWVPGSIIELPKHAEAELDLMVNNKPVGLGHAVKVNENFGIRITFIGDVRARIAAMGTGETATPLPMPSEGGGGGSAAGGDQSPEALAEALLAGQT